MCFNAAKSKCIVIPPIRARHRVVYRLGSDCDLAFSINAGKIDFVESYKHLGHVINSAFDDREDIADKRGAFVGQGIMLFVTLINSVLTSYSSYSMHIVLVFSAASFGDSITPSGFVGVSVDVSVGQLSRTHQRPSAGQVRHVRRTVRRTVGGTLTSRELVT
jgi:hypothetical protein